MLILANSNQIYKKKLPNEVSNRAVREVAKVLLNPFAYVHRSHLCVACYPRLVQNYEKKSNRQ